MVATSEHCTDVYVARRPSRKVWIEGHIGKEIKD